MLSVLGLLFVLFWVFFLFFLWKLSCTSQVLYKEGLGTGIPTLVTPEMERVKRNQENISSVLLSKTNPTISNANQIPLTPPYYIFLSIICWTLNNPFSNQITKPLSVSLYFFTQSNLMVIKLYQLWDLNLVYSKQLSSTLFFFPVK